MESKQRDPLAPIVRSTCDVCEMLGREAVQEMHLGGGYVFNFGPINAHRSCYDSWYDAHQEL